MRVRRRYRLLMVGGLGLVGLGVAWQPDGPPTGVQRGEPVGDGLWVGTFNVNFEYVDPSTAAVVEGADVWFLQETHAAWEALLPEAPYRSFTRHEREGGMGVLSRFPVLAVPSAPAGVHFPGSCVEVDTPGGLLRVLHLHLLPPLSEDGGLLEGYLATPPARLAELDAHLVACPSPDLVLGDLNEGDGPSTARLAELGFVESQVALGAPDTTWSWSTTLGTLRGRPDHVFVGPRLRLYAVQVGLERGASDHHPLRAQVGWR